jgi:hypothetical protein
MAWTPFALLVLRCQDSGRVLYYVLGRVEYNLANTWQQVDISQLAHIKTHVHRSLEILNNIHHLPSGNKIRHPDTTSSTNHMELTYLMASINDQEMSSQPDFCTPGPSQEEQEAHNLEPKGYTLISWKQLISTGEAAKAKRAKYKSERQQKQEKRNAFHNRNNKERIIQQKGIEIQELCVKVSGMRERHREEMEVLMQQKEQSEMESRERIKELKEDKEEMKREHTVEIESRDQMQAILLVDLRELCQVYDKEVEMLRRTINRQGRFLHPFDFFNHTFLTNSISALPPDYSSINNPSPVTTLTDSGPATPDLVIATSLTSLRKTLASASTHPNPLVCIANTLHTSLTTIKHGHSFHLWPRSSTSTALHAIHECVDRVTQFLSLHPELQKQTSISSSSGSPTSPFLSRLPSLTRGTNTNANTILRRAFTVADTLALELCSLHFASGGRRAGLQVFGEAGAAATSSNSGSNNNSIDRTTDQKDDLLDLQYWKKAFENVRVEASEWREEVGVVVFEDTVAWLEMEVMRLV